MPLVKNKTKVENRYNSITYIFPLFRPNFLKMWKYYIIQYIIYRPSVTLSQKFFAFSKKPRDCGQAASPPPASQN